MDTRTEVPPGYWALESSENPQPISPMAESFFLEAQTAGARHVFAEFGLLIETAQWRAFDGWVYLRVVPFVGDDAAMGERVGRCIAAVEDDLAARLVDRWYDGWRPWLDRRAAELRGVDLPTLSDEGLDTHLGEVVDFVFAATDVHLLLHGSGALMLGEFVLCAAQWLGWDEVALLDLFSGSSPASTEPGRELAELAGLIRERPPLRSLIAEPTTDLAALIAADPEFAAAFARWAAEVGGRAIRYEVVDPTFAERPEVVLGLLRDQLDRPFDADAVARQLMGRQAAARAAARATLAERAPQHRERFEQLLTRAERVYPIREDNEVRTQNVPLGLARGALLEVGRRLAAAGSIAHPDDVFLLQLDEARSALRAHSDRTDLVAARRTTREKAQANPGPGSYGTPPPEPDFSPLPAPAALAHQSVGWLIDRILDPAAASHRQSGPVVTGQAASPGRARGPARVVRHEDELGRVRPGDVLVCPITSPAWSLVFPTIAALVTDTGGVLSHAAIIAREFAIPAVVATGNATTLFADGQVLLVDGDAGTVTVAP